MSLVGYIKSAVGLGQERKTEIGFMPTVRRDNLRPKFKLRKEVNAQGQIYIPAETRKFEKRSDIGKGDKFSLDIFAPNYNNSERSRKRKMYVNVNVISGNRITIPAEVRDELELREGDTIAVHGYWQESGE